MARLSWSGRTAAGVATAVVAALLPHGAPTSAHAAAEDRNTASDTRLVDSVPTPRLRWYRCYGHAECATVRLPRDYDRPRGARVEIAVLRVKARNPQRRIGSLFLNPGGPGGSGTAIAHAAPFFLSRRVLNRFDIVGFDPRGTNFSDQVKCFPGNREQGRALAGLLGVAFPVTRPEERAAIRSARRMGRACSSFGRPLSASMSTGQVARDMDVLRRAVGDRRLSYLGFSYGSYLGQVYANMFPGRVRAVAIDGVLDPVAWAGTPATRSRPQSDRLRSADGAYRALHEILIRCDRAGRPRCAFAPGDPVANYDLVARRLKRNPLIFVDPATGEQVSFGYADLVGFTLGAMYDPFGYEYITEALAELIILTDPSDRASATQGANTLKAFAARVARLREQLDQRRRAWDFPYDNSFEAFSSVLCTDGLNPRRATSWPAATAAADRRAKYFGRAWGWASVQCARRTWTARDEDSYRGPFSRRTATPVLVIGNFWDPATNYRGAVTAARLLPNSRLLSSDSWGHTAYGTSQCVTAGIERYLLTRALPPRGRVCHGDIQPFEDTPAAHRSLAPTRQLPPVVPPVIPSFAAAPATR